MGARTGGPTPATSTAGARRKNSSPNARETKPPSRRRVGAGQNREALEKGLLEFGLKILASGKFDVLRGLDLQRLPRFWIDAHARLAIRDLEGPKSDELHRLASVSYTHLRAHETPE